MATISKNDELNIISTGERKQTKRKPIPFKKYFGEMLLTDLEIEMRMLLAQELSMVFAYVFGLMAIEFELGNDVDQNYYSDLAYRKYTEALAENNIFTNKAIYDEYNSKGQDEPDSKSADTDSVNAMVNGKTQKPITLYEGIDEYVKGISEDIVSVTLKHFDDAYYTSKDRAMVIAENESNTIMNQKDDVDAINQGLDTKQWITMEDELVRHSHALVDKEIVGIHDSFDVGGVLMKYPKDPSGPPQETINCRCTMRYYKNNGTPEYF